MLFKIQKYFCSIKPVFLDGSLYVLIAMFGAMESILNQDDAYKYWNVYVLYFTKFIVIVLIAGLMALKMFRSTQYGEHLQDKKDALVISSSKIVENKGETTEVKTETQEKKP